MFLQESIGKNSLTIHLCIWTEINFTENWLMGILLITFHRCLEEGAEEFFLKPVRLSDVNKLKPHMMKTKNKDLQKPEKEVEQEALSSETPEVKSSEQQEQQPQQEANNKRKAMELEEGLPQDRTRRRYNGLTAV